VWFTDAAIAIWKAEPGRIALLLGPHDHDGALALRAVFHLALHQTEGLIGSIITEVMWWTALSPGTVASGGR
jgi:hypothetical protein